MEMKDQAEEKAAMLGKIKQARNALIAENWEIAARPTSFRY